MRRAGSILFAMWLCIATPPFSVIALLSSPLPAMLRWRIISQWSRLSMFFIRVFCGIRWRVEGLENLPPSPCVLLSRHESAWETIAYQSIFPPHAMVLKRELLRIPFFGWGLARMSPIPIDREAGHSALRILGEAGAQRISDGFYVSVFPEGTRMRPGERRPWHIGGAWLAHRAGVPAVPVAVDSGACWPRNSFWKRAGVVTVKIGLPVSGDLTPQEINDRARNWVESALASSPNQDSA